jgi:hypothetical protein
VLEAIIKDKYMQKGIIFLIFIFFLCSNPQQPLSIEDQFKKKLEHIWLFYLWDSGGEGDFVFKGAALNLGSPFVNIN